MRKIQLLGMELEGFRSFRERTLIELPTAGGFRFLSGDNKPEPRMGGNGAGKSTLWDAVSWCIGNRSIKGLRAGDLLSWQGADTIAVSTFWEIDGAFNTIRRQGMPDKLTLNDEPVEQIAIERLLGLSRARFMQSVIFGQTVPLFADLSNAERGALLDEVLDLGIWLKAAETASGKYSTLEKTVAGLDRDITFAQGKLDGMESLAAINAAIDVWETNHNSEIDHILTDMAHAEQELEELHKVSRKANTEKPDTEALSEQQATHDRALIKRRNDLALFGDELDRADRRLEFYKHTEVCETCGQSLNPEFVTAQQKELTKLIADRERAIIGTKTHIKELNATITELADKIAQATRKFSEADRAAAVAESRCQDQERRVNELEQRAEALAGQVNPHLARRDALQRDRQQIEQQLSTLQADKRKTRGALLRLDFWRQAFKRVRLFMTRHTLTQLEMEVQSAAMVLGLVGWRIQFNTELETKSGSLKPGIHITVTSPNSKPAPWEAWSGGEGQRARIAISIGLASLIQRMAGITIGIEVWDEPSAWLSQEGIEDLLECLKQRAATTGKALWIVDHRALAGGGFSAIWQVEKTNAGSRLLQLTGE